LPMTLTVTESADTSIFPKGQVAERLPTAAPPRRE